MFTPGEIRALLRGETVVKNGRKYFEVTGLDPETNEERVGLGSLPLLGPRLLPPPGEEEIAPGA